MYKKTFLIAFVIIGANILFTWFAGECWNLTNMYVKFISENILSAQWQIPILSLIMLVAMWGALYLDPYRKNLESSKNIMTVSIIGFSMVSLAMQMSIILSIVNIISTGTAEGLRVVMIFGSLFGIGNYLSTARKSYLSGLPTPWTMKSDLSWAKTHRLLGRSLMMISIVSLIITLMFDTKTGTTIFLTSYAVVLVAAIFYSYLVWKKECEQNAP